MTLMDGMYLPFSKELLKEHFADVRSSGDPDRHLKYYQTSIDQVELTNQRQKDERFWVATALMSIFHADGSEGRADLFAHLMGRSGVNPPAGFQSWQEAFQGDLRLYFEANLPSPPAYRDWLRKNLDERSFIPYLRDTAMGTKRLEGSTKVDAILISELTHTAVIFEAKVLSDISPVVRYDVARNQLARIIDVALDRNNRLLKPLKERDPARTSVVLLTPELFSPKGPVGAKGSRLYQWLMPAYRESGNPTLGQHLPHRSEHELEAARARLGWLTWEDCNFVLPGACPWLPAVGPSSPPADNVMPA